MKSSEKYLVAILIFALAIGGVGLYLIMPAFDSISKKSTDIQQKETLIKQLEQTKIALAGNIEKYKKLKKLPDTITVRQFNPDTFEANIKEMIDHVVALATNNGNEFIALKPWAPPPLFPPPPKTEKGQDEAEIPQDPVADKLRTYGYEFSMRGAYDNINGFLGALSQYPELVELFEIKIQNEKGQDRDANDIGTSLGNPLKPIKITMKVILYLQNEF